MEAFRFVPGLMANPDRCPNFVGAPAQAPQHFHRRFEVGGFAQHLPINRDQRIGGDDDRIGRCPRNERRFPCSIPGGDFPDGQPIM